LIKISSGQRLLYQLIPLSTFTFFFFFSFVVPFFHSTYQTFFSLFHSPLFICFSQVRARFLLPGRFLFPLASPRRSLYLSLHTSLVEFGRPIASLPPFLLLRGSLSRVFRKPRSFFGASLFQFARPLSSFPPFCFFFVESFRSLACFVTYEPTTRASVYPLSVVEPFVSNRVLKEWFFA